MERISVCSTYSHYWCPPGLGSWPSSLYTPSHSALSYPHMVSPIVAILMTFKYFFLSPPSDTQVATRISACQADNSAWMWSYHLKLNLDKTELLFLPANIKAVVHSCRFMLYNIRGVRPYLSPEVARVQIQLLDISSLDNCILLLACAVKPLQLIQNAAARLVFNLPRLSHTPPVEARINYKIMVLACLSIPSGYAETLHQGSLTGSLWAEVF
ncbi:uncharacterized protein LOC118362581 [Oncorhynchus keta]|uniref:uncharacterized protein LOC118362581 n=1 Tax=Oncorhynchus keta TaxID=8018 RepID=UPI0015FAC5B3|nr:uncharacterized protein LOC118362581 [Oncorhynchus keta]